MSRVITCQLSECPAPFCGTGGEALKRGVGITVRRQNPAQEYGLQTQPFFWFTTSKPMTWVHPCVQA